MAKKMVRVVARVVALSEKVEEVKLVLLGLVEPTRRESGCIHYELLHAPRKPGGFCLCP